ncbi:MAG: bifunctional DNA-formamidopyrimidine glycosylase/DNA-(apurinic or apyrimidinic site) lyase [Rhodanobacter sp.]
MPEVETIRRGLDATVRGARIESVEVLWPPFVDATRGLLDTAVVGHQISAIRRRGKALIMDVGGDWHLLLHLKMTGQVVVHRHGQLVAFGGHPTANIVGPMPNSWTRAILALSADRTVFLNDQRKFAHLRVVTTADLAADPFLSGMGPEALDDRFSLAVFKQRLARFRSAPIKAALLDQAVVAGIGNIYADEILHLARIDPRQPTASVTAPQLRRLHQAIRTILRDAVEHCGTSYPSFIDDGQHRDTYLDHARLFGQQGQPCMVCGTRIERIRVAGRGTNYCPHCQRARSALAP